MKVFLFGAGATAGTFPKQVPTAGQFGAFLNRNRRGGLKAFPAIEKAVHHLELDASAFTLEEVWTAFDYYAKLQEALPTTKQWVNESPNIKRAILRVYGKRCDRLAKGLPVDASYPLGLLLKEVKPGDMLVSLNYDTLIENLAKRFGHKLSVAYAAGPPVENAVFLSKPHGSVSWTIDFNKRTVKWHDNGSPLSDSLSEKDVLKKLEPLVLGTVPIKSELIREVQCDFPEIFSIVTCQWKALLNALIKANTLVIVGYGFPREDQYGRFMFKEAMRRKKAKMNIQYFELPHKAAELRREICDIFGCKLATLEYRGQVKPSTKKMIGV